MRFRLSPAAAIRFILALVVLAGSAALISETKSPFTTADKAYYLDENAANFIRPGLQINILSASIASDGTIQTRFKLTDPKGQPLDRAGNVTPGSISVSFIAAYIPAGKTQYVSYTTRSATSPITGATATQASGENNGTFAEVGDGEYTYTFRAKAPAGFDANVTHTIGAYGSRNLSEFDLATNYDDATFNFVPAGSAVTVTRDVIQSATCNKCHHQLAFHGGSRRTIELCVLCHTPQTSDPDTGNTVDMPVMAHKIHMGKDLPSVVAGGHYQIIGNAQSVHDYSEVGFPAGINNCGACHGNDSAAQKDNYFKANRAACGACHDNVNFATGENHANLPQLSDNQCSTCHTPEGELEFDVSIKGAHVTPTLSRDLGGVNLEILGVENTAPGQKPTVRFSMKDKSGNVLKVSDMNRLALVLAGPTTDYNSFKTGYVSEDAMKAAMSGDTATYTFENAIPENAKGSFTVGIEGYRNATLLAGTKKEITVRDAAINKTMTFSVDGSPVAMRREVVSLAKCNNCHSFLSLHGGNRNTIDQCVLCHNPVENDASVRPAAQSPAESIDLRTMVHRIHAGKSQTREYIIYGRGGSVNNFSDIGYPGDLANCSACHVNGSENLPLKDTLSMVNDNRGLINPVGPVTVACTGCHTSVAAASHALTNTSTLGEACAACHGASAQFSVARVHAR